VTQEATLVDVLDIPDVGNDQFTAESQSGAPAGQAQMPPTFLFDIDQIPGLGNDQRSITSNESASVVSAYFYKMRGRDVTCPAGQQPAYVYWVVQGEPDPLALQATVGDLVCGADPLLDIVDIDVAHKWLILGGT
jgi:hypothetical protein